MDPQSYEKDEQVRQELVEVLNNHGYNLDSYALSDKGEDRTVTVKASRNLQYTQLKLEAAE